MSAFTASAKDVITKTDGTKIDAKVEEVTESVIRYRKISNPTGPIYSIAITSISSVQYENGTVDSFVDSSSVTSSSSLSDEELIKYVEGQGLDNPTSNNLSDADLLKLYGGDDISNNRISKFRKIGWIGGGSIFLAGTAVGLILWGLWDFDSSDFPTCGAIIGSSLAVGAIWCVGFNLKANSMQKQAQMMRGYTVPVFEKNFKIDDSNSFTAGISVIGNQYHHDHGLGFSIGINF